MALLLPAPVLVPYNIVRGSQPVRFGLLRTISRLLDLLPPVTGCCCFTSSIYLTLHHWHCSAVLYVPLLLLGERNTIQLLLPTEPKSATAGVEQQLDCLLSLQQLTL